MIKPNSYDAVTPRAIVGVLAIWVLVVCMCLTLVAMRRLSPGRYVAVYSDRESALVLDTATGSVYLTEGTPLTGRITFNPAAKRKVTLADLMAK